MKNSVNSYHNLDDVDKKKLLQELYINDKLSFGNIAKMYDTYANKLRRDAVKYGIKIRDKSQAQKNAIQTGSHKHPTKGQSRPQDIKDKIGNSVMKSWENLSEDELQKRKNNSKERWEALDIDSQAAILKMANEAVRESSKKGSKLEKYLLEKLIQDNIKVQFHKEQTLLNTKLQIDLFLPEHNIAIEVDGPSHFEPVWGKESLKKNKKYDAKKEGLILGKAWKLIRIKQTKDFSKTRGSLVYAKLVNSINTLTNQSNTISKIIIEDC
jgi:very-short-patch-repair endonuclease